MMTVVYLMHVTCDDCIQTKYVVMLKLLLDDDDSVI